ncbi:aromatic amino acid aminotransferase [Diaporthe helianthi]|uniref:Aromatic amino acid aminotransferase n=1 Tax=Diaporthe helianthi TaxID=158607 RepID=A0A2P5ICR9_DIAHE|nr:aromatic amino acid aminotransferase [Diaporthe helianthi]
MESNPAAAASSSGMATKPKPKDFSHYYSVTTAHRTPSAMKAYYKFFQIPGIGNLAGGLPNLQFFPFDTLEAQTAKPERWTPSPNKPDGTDDLAASTASLKINHSSDPAAASHITVPKSLSDESDFRKKIDLATALQYGQAQGYPPLYSYLRQFTREQLHPNVPYEGGVDICLTVGATDGMAKTLELFVDPWSPETGDVRDRPGLLCETFMYANVLSQSQPKGVQIVPVKADDGGMVATGPGSLDDVLTNWDYSKGRRPHLLYTVTMGHNPTGILLSLERRKALYAVASKFDVLIIEDDPYWYLQFPSAAVEEGKSRNKPPVADALSTPHKPEKSTGYPFLDSLVPSFLSVDTDGRVIRLDTFSKTVAPGCRLGFVTAQPGLIERFVRVAESSTQQPSGFVQSMIAQLIIGRQASEVERSWLSLRKASERATFTGWDTSGWVRWIEGLRGEYERRMNRMCRILDDGAAYVKQGTPVSPTDSDLCVLTKTQLYDFSWPRGGMFVWVRVFFESHPLFGAASSDGKDIVDGNALATGLLIFLTKNPYKVLISPGMMFAATEEIRRSVGWQYFRLCFAAETEENVDSCSERFVEGVKKYWSIKKVKDLEDLVKESPVAAQEDDAVDDIGNLGLYFGC